MDFFEKFVILSAILLPIKLPVASAVFLIALFDAVFGESVADFLALSRVFDRIYCLNFYSFFAYFWFNWISHIYKLHLITIVKFMLSSISYGWLFWYVNHTLLFGYSELNVFKNIWFVGEISSRLPNGLFGTNVYRTLESCWQSLLTMFQCYYVCNFKMCHIFIIFVFSFLFSVLSSNSIVSDVKSTRLYPSLILNVFLLSVSFTYICSDGLSLFSPCFFKMYSKQS